MIHPEAMVRCKELQQHSSTLCPVLTDDLLAGVFLCDGHSAGRTPARFLQPHLHAHRAEHVVVGTNHRLPDLHGQKPHTTVKVQKLSLIKHGYRVKYSIKHNYRVKYMG